VGKKKPAAAQPVKVDFLRLLGLLGGHETEISPRRDHAFRAPPIIVVLRWEQSLVTMITSSYPLVILR
jgi:hypothetical protein